MNTIRFLLCGDLVGEPGRAVFARNIDGLRKKYKPDVVIVNGENSAHGKGITPTIIKELKTLGVDVITTGNHVWQRKEVFLYLESHTDVLRPANYPSACPGTGVTVITCNNIPIGIVNLIGRVFMRDDVECPFRAADSILTYLKTKTRIILIDFHAEATSEKVALGLYLDGRVSAVVGTHTHVQTADNRILPKGTAYVTDLGMGGSLNSAIGVHQDAIIKRFLTQMPHKHEVSFDKPFVLCGVCIEVDIKTGKATCIERIYLVEDL